MAHAAGTWMLFVYYTTIFGAPAQQAIAMLNTEQECRVAAVIEAQLRPQNDYSCSESIAWDRVMRSVIEDQLNR